MGKVVSVALFWLCPLDHRGRLEEINLTSTRYLLERIIIIVGLIVIPAGITQTWKVCLFDRFPTVRLVARKVVDVKKFHFYAQHSSLLHADGLPQKSGSCEN